MKPRRIDAHQHFWRVVRADYHWLPTSGPLHRDYLPSDLAPLTSAADISGTITVQAAQTQAETAFLLELAQSPANHILGVVGWLPLEAVEAPALLEQLAAQPKIVGVRPMLHDLEQVDWITQPVVVENLRRLPALGLCFDVLSYPQHLPYVWKALDQVPDLPVVIDHLSKPPYGPTLEKEWQHWLKQLAQNPKVCCKLSGMVTEVGAAWKVDDFRAYANYVLETFGPSRVMFGSDWPVCLTAASYAQVVELTARLVSELDDEKQAQVWGETAAKFYGV